MIRWKHPGVKYVPWTGKVVKMAVELPKAAYVKDLKRILAERMGVDPGTVDWKLDDANYSCYRPRYFQESFINTTRTTCC